MACNLATLERLCFTVKGGNTIVPFTSPHADGSKTPANEAANLRPQEDRDKERERERERESVRTAGQRDRFKENRFQKRRDRTVGKIYLRNCTLRYTRNSVRNARRQKSRNVAQAAYHRVIVTPRKKLADAVILSRLVLSSDGARKISIAGFSRGKSNEGSLVCPPFARKGAQSRRKDSITLPQREKERER